MLKPLLLGLALALSGCVAGRSAQAPPVASQACSMSAEDRQWIDLALEAWRFTSQHILEIERLPEYRVIFFDDDCVMTSADALSSQTAEGVTWTHSAHDGQVTLPNGNTLPVGVTTFASGEGGMFFFVMSTPTVWEAAGIGEGEDLRRTMVAVFLHESSHIAQLGPYGPKLGSLIERYSLPDSFSDDTMQHRFGENPEFAASVKRESELFLEAAASEDDAQARRLAGEALRMLRDRQARWLVGEDAYLVEAEDLWLTLEGAGQWVAFQWLGHPQGGGQDRAEVLDRFMRNRWWSQTEGFAVAMALDRLAGPRWKRHAFGDGAQTILQMLEAAVSEG